MSQWHIEVSDDLDHRVRDHLAQQGGGDLTAYVNKAVRRQLLRETIHTIRARNAEADPAEVENEIAQALEEVRADRP